MNTGKNIKLLKEHVPISYTYVIVDLKNIFYKEVYTEPDAGEEVLIIEQLINQYPIVPTLTTEEQTDYKNVIECELC